MTIVFADTFYYLALLNPRDRAHAVAMSTTEGLTAKLLTTEYILTEVADAMAHPLDRPKFLALVENLRNHSSVTILPSDPSLFAKGLELYRRRPDKDWPLTDCISFEVMNERGITEALTADIHFRQAGFKNLFE
jgi:predicted nucleic acid-binding protein